MGRVHDVVGMSLNRESSGVSRSHLSRFYYRLNTIHLELQTA